MSFELSFRPRVFPLETCPTAGELLAALQERERPCLLESGGGSPAHFSLLGFDPLDAGGLPTDLAGLRRYLGRLRRGAGELPPGPFHGGFLGALGYELGVAGESLALPDDPWGAPPIVGGLYTDFVVIDHRASRAWLVLGEDPGDGRPALARRRDEVLGRLAEETPVEPPRSVAHGPLIRHVSAEVHRERIERVRGLIESGEIYQANLAHRFSRAMSGSPVDLYRRLRSFNRAPYMGYLDWGAGALLDRKSVV
jgi:anthranilate/para-aminobenzoate synthase component I